MSGWRNVEEYPGERAQKRVTGAGPQEISALRLRLMGEPKTASATPRTIGSICIGTLAGSYAMSAPG
jgi:hypothetical protein